MTELNLKHQRVLIREDFNVPIVQNRIMNDRRILAAIPTIEYVLNQGAAVILLSHLGRPNLNSPTSQFSLTPVAEYLSNHLNQPVRLIKDWVNGISVNSGEVVLCENVRLQSGELTNDPTLAKKISNLADIIVMDAFAVAHRINSSTVGMIQYAQQACAGLLLLSELENLECFKQQEQPVVGLIGGAKVSTKLNALEALMERVDHLLLGGGIANTCLAAQSKHIGQSFYEPQCIDPIQQLLRRAESYHCQIHLPQDVIVTTTQQDNEVCIKTKSISDIQPNDKIGDIGPLTILDYKTCFQTAGSILWNGPMGLYEQVALQKGTWEMAHAISSNPSFSMVGGGETIAAIEQYHLYPTCLSTGGGALLAGLTDKPLPAIQALQAHS